MKLPFTKMHGTGNDFVVLDCLQHKIAKPAEVAKQLCDRRFGIGADQMLVIERSPTVHAEFRMAIYNADGSEVEMCGNGIRCFAKYLRDRNITGKPSIRVHTDAGIIVPSFEPSGLIRVDMGEPVLDGEKIPTTWSGPVLKKELQVLDRTFSVTAVSMGNPHCVIFVDNVDTFPVDKYGPATENHPNFPRRVNTEYIQVIDRDNLKMRVWERGAGETMACGTGACAALVAAVQNGLANRKATLHLKGGTLSIEWSEADNRVYMTGPAAEVFTGTVEVPSIKA